MHSLGIGITLILLFLKLSGQLAIGWFLVFLPYVVGFVLTWLIAFVILVLAVAEPRRGRRSL